MRASVTLFLRNRSSDFSEILYEVRVQKVRKNVPSAFLIIFTVLAILAKNSPKWVFLAQSDKKWRFFAFFSRTTHQIFLIFCSKHSLWSRKKMTFSLFWGNFKSGPFWSKLTQIWPYLAISGLKHRCSKKIFGKNFEIFYFFFISLQNRKKNYFGQRKSTIFLYEHHYDSPLPTLRKILKFLKWRFFAFFSKKIKNFIIFSFLQLKYG